MSPISGSELLPYSLRLPANGSRTALVLTTGSQYLKLWYPKHEF